MSVGLNALTHQMSCIVINWETGEPDLPLPQHIHRDVQAVLVLGAEGHGAPSQQRLRTPRPQDTRAK